MSRVTEVVTPSPAPERQGICGPFHEKSPGVGRVCGPFLYRGWPKARLTPPSVCAEGNEREPTRSELFAAATMRLVLRDDEEISPAMNEWREDPRETETMPG